MHMDVNLYDGRRTFESEEQARRVILGSTIDLGNPFIEITRRRSLIRVDGGTTVVNRPHNLTESSYTVTQDWSVFPRVRDNDCLDLGFSDNCIDGLDFYNAAKIAEASRQLHLEPTENNFASFKNLVSKHQFPYFTFEYKKKTTQLKLLETPFKNIAEGIVRGFSLRGIEYILFKPQLTPNSTNQEVSTDLAPYFSKKLSFEEKVLYDVLRDSIRSYEKEKSDVVANPKIYLNFFGKNSDFSLHRFYDIVDAALFLKVNRMSSSFLPFFQSMHNTEGSINILSSEYKH